MTKNVNFSSNTAVFYTYTLEEYPGRIPDPPLRLTFKDATELLELRSLFRKETKELEAVRAKLEEEQEQNRRTDISSNSDLSETQECAMGRETSGEELRRRDVLSETRKLNLDVQQPASALVTPPLSPTGENGPVSPPSQTEPPVCLANSHHPSPPPSPAPSAQHSCPPPIRPSSSSSRCEQIDLPLSQPLARLCIPNNHCLRIERMPLSPTAKQKSGSPTPPSSSPKSSSCLLQDYQSIAQDSNVSHSNDIRPYGARLVEV